MSILIIKNIESEGPGTIEDYLKGKKISYGIVELGAGEILPSLDNIDTLIILGGPMGVYEMDKYPHLRTCSRLIREAINREIKILGICLGAQMIAYCLGGNVFLGNEKEIGWHYIELTGEGIKDPLMRQLAIHPTVGDFWRRFKVFHWHGDTFDLPADTVLLASSKIYKNQAFRYGNNVYGFQFHIEVTREMINEWFQDSPDLELILKETEKTFDEYVGRAFKFYKFFFGK